MFGTSEERQRWVLTRSRITNSALKISFPSKISQVVIFIYLLFLPTKDSYLSGMVMAVIIIFFLLIFKNDQYIHVWYLSRVCNILGIVGNR